MEIFKYIAVGIIGMIMVVTVRNIKPEYSIFIAIVTGIVIIISLSGKAVEVVNTFENIADKSGISSTIFSAIIKIVGIGYITEYSAGICEDYSCSNIAKKIQLAGKITIFVMALPVITGIIDIVGGLVE